MQLHVEQVGMLYSKCYAPLLEKEIEEMATVSSQRTKVKGVNFVVDEGNEKKAVIIDLKKHRAIWEDFYDTLLAKKREKEPRETLEEVRNRMLERR